MNISFPSLVLRILFLQIIFSFNIILPDVRYVSNTGTSKFPYTSWETASDSIQKCINICNSGDTIYVANGIYKEQIVMTPSLSLIGAGMDSCIIDTKELITSNNTTAVSIADSCQIKGFNIKVSTGSSVGFGIAVQVGTTNCLITLNKISQGGIGIEINNVDTSNHSNIIIYKNTFNNVGVGIDFFNSNTVVRGNIIYTDPNTDFQYGVELGSYYYNTYAPIIDSNYIEAQWAGIDQSFGSKPTINNNTIVFKNFGGGDGINIGDSDSAFVSNNLIINFNKNRLGAGIQNMGTRCLTVNNNYISGDCVYGSLQLLPGDIARNNLITKSSIGVKKLYSYPDPVFRYNNLWNNTVNYKYFIPDSTNTFLNPMTINDTSDFHLQMFSPLIDRGDPAILDKDSTRSDIGLYGGPLGESYKYLDYPPDPPRGIDLKLDTNYITVKWNKNTEADFHQYNLFRDTIAGFTANQTTLVLSLTDSTYTHIAKPGVNKYFYKLTSEDNQGNFSALSEELGINITFVNDQFQVISDYHLFQNYPNPFNPATTISYRLKERGYVKIMVYSVSGELIGVLVNQNQEKGYHEIKFSGEKAIQLASGVYIYQLIVKNEKDIPVFADIKKMIYLK
jgi:hypothetical protein